MAAVPYLNIDGVNVLPYIEAGGLKWTENDLDSPTSGRTLDGTMHRGKVSSKVKLEIKCLPLDVSDARALLTAVSKQYVTVSTNIDPKNGVTSYSMYNSTRPVTCYIVDPKTGIGKWHDLAFNLIER